MPKRPTRRPRWAYDAAAGRLVEAPSGYQEQGFSAGERPPAQWINYVFNLTAGCIDFLMGPSFANWTHRDIGSEIETATLACIDADVYSNDDGVYSRVAMAGNDDTGSLRVYVSHRGHEWDECSNFTDATLGTFRGIKTFLGLWFLWTEDNLLGTPADDGSASALTVGGGNDWMDYSEADVIDVAASDVSVVLIKRATPSWEYRNSSTTFAAIGVTGTPTGVGLAIVWSGQKFVSITSTGQIWTGPAGVVTGTNMALVATLSTATDWKLVADPVNERVLAYRANTASPPLYYSDNHGSSWTVVTLPALLDSITSVVYTDGQYVAGSSVFPYLWTSNDGITWYESYVPVPQDTAGFAIKGVAAALRSVVLMGPEGQWILQSTVSNDAANGDATTFTTPVPRSDAAYFQGREVSEVAPGHAQVLAYNSATERYEPADAGVVFGSSKTFFRTFGFSGSAYDYTGDFNWNPVAYPDSDTDLDSSALLGDDDLVPMFYAVNKDGIAACALTGTNQLRFTWATGANTWPETNGGPIGKFPLPQSRRMTVRFTVRLGATTLEASNRLCFGIARGRDGGQQPEALCKVFIEASSSSAADETVTIWGNAYSGASVNTYVASNAFTRFYRIVIDGPNLAVYGGAVGATVANTLIHGRSNALRASAPGELFLFVGAAVGATEDGLYWEISNLHWSGTEE